MEPVEIEEIAVSFQWKISGRHIAEVQISCNGSARDLRRPVTELLPELPHWSSLELFFGEVLLEDFQSITALGIRDGSMCDVVARDRDVIAVAMASCSTCVNISLLSTETGQELAMHAVSPQVASAIDIRDFTWAPNGSVAAVAWSGWIDEEANTSIIELRLLDMQFGHSLHTIPLHSSGEAIDFQCRFSPSTDILAVVESSPVRVSIFAVGSGCQIHQVIADEVVEEGLDVAMDFLPSGAIMVGGFHGLGIIDIHEGSLAATCCKLLGGCISFLRTAPTVQLMVAGFESKARLVAMDTLQIVDILLVSHLDDFIECASFAPEGSILAIGFLSGRITIYDVAHGQFAPLVSWIVSCSWFTWAGGEILAFIQKGQKGGEQALVKMKIASGDVRDLTIPKVAGNYCFSSRSEVMGH